jgi:cyclic pyranopterin phosphate synthase
MDTRDDSLSHLRTDEQGRTSAHMVDVGGKPASRRVALARALVEFGPGLLDRVLAQAGPKGPVEEVARVAGIMAAKRTADLIPMCHPLALEQVEVEFERLDEATLEVRCRAQTTGPTGVEMEAMTGAGVAALCVYDMVKGLDKAVRLGRVELLEKSGGRSGHWRREPLAGSDPAP